MLWLCYDLRDTLPVVYTNKKYIWNDLIKKKKKTACPCTSYRFQPSLSWILKCTVPFSSFYETVLMLTYQPGLFLPAPCSTLPSLFPRTQHCDACITMTVSCPCATWRPLIQTKTKIWSPSDKLTRWLMKPCMGERDARGCRWILTWNISWRNQYNRGSRSPHRQ